MLRFFLILSVFLLAGDYLTGGAKAVEIRSPECQKLFRKWEREVGYKAFALSENGRSCGWGGAYKTARLAKARALKECRVKSRNCYIFRQAHVVGIASKECKKTYKQFRKFKQHRSFAVSASGIYCGVSFGYASTKAAVKRALKECRTRKAGKCYVYE